jgi:hypothetical protein
MMDYEPEQGVPRYVSYESESRSDSLVRRGLAFIIEHGFFKTEIGRQHYLMNLKQIVEAVHETVYYGVIHELLAAPNFYEQWQKKHGKKNSIVTNDAVTTLAEERWRFGCVQKDIKGLFVLDAEIKDRMRRVGIEPNGWIFPSKMAIYASMVPEYFNEYNRGGNKATTALEDGAKRFDVFRGNRVYETRTFDTDFMNAGAIEPLVRHRQVGEYYVLGAATEDYKHGMQIFDMSRDRFHKISYKDAVDNSITGNLGEDVNIVASLAKHWRDNSGHGEDTQILHALGQAFDCTPTDAHLAQAAVSPAWVPAAGGYADSVNEACYNFVRAQRVRGGVDPSQQYFTSLLNDNAAVAAVAVNANVQQGLAGHVLLMNDHKACYIPHQVLMFRPRMTYRMATAILLKGGEELGQTLHGHHDFQLTDDVIHKTHIGHYTFYSKSVVREPKLMYMAEDVYCVGYEGGENTEFITPGRIRGGELSATEITGRSPSLLSILIPHGYPLDACLSVIGNLEDHDLPTIDEKDGRYGTQDVMNTVVDRTALNPSPTTMFDSANDGEIGMNGVCFRGAEYGYSKKTATFSQRQQNTGHWGPNVYDGCGMVRMGMYAHLKAL